MGLQPQMVRELGAIVRNQIPAGRKSVLDAYGDVLYRAWREGSGLCLLELEDFVQVGTLPCTHVPAPPVQRRQLDAAESRGKSSEMGFEIGSRRQKAIGKREESGAGSGGRERDTRPGSQSAFHSHQGLVDKGPEGNSSRLAGKKPVNCRMLVRRA